LKQKIIEERKSKQVKIDSKRKTKLRKLIIMRLKEDQVNNYVKLHEADYD